MPAPVKVLQILLLKWWLVLHSLWAGILMSPALGAILQPSAQTLLNQ